MRLGTVEVGAEHPCRIVAELSCNHGGSFDRAIRLIDAAQEAGADLVKFQCFSLAEMAELRGDGMAPAPWDHLTKAELYAKAQTPLEWFPRLAAHCASIGMPWFSSVFGLQSLACLEELQCPAFKIARLDTGSSNLLWAVKATGRPLLFSHATNPLFGWENGGQVLFCPPGYPPNAGDIRLPFFNGVRAEQDERYPRWLGLSSHCLAPELPVAAVARGAKLLEYHLQLAEEPGELDGAFSLNQYQFRALVRSVRETEALLA